MKEICVRCGMVANLDPQLHRERYAHTPEVRRDGKLFRFSFVSWTFRPVDEAEEARQARLDHTVEVAERVEFFNRVSEAGRSAR